MNRISTYATLTLFARTALRRLANRCTSLSLENLKKKTSGESAPQARAATRHRSQQKSLFRRILGLWLPAAMLIGLVMPSVCTTFVLIDAVRLAESRSAAVLRIPAASYESLQKAVALGSQEKRESALKQVLADCYSSSATWLTDGGMQLAKSRFDERGLAAFEPLPADAASSFASLSPAGQSLAMRSIGGFLILIHLAMLCLAFGVMSKNIVGADTALAWLWQFPVSRRVLFTSKLIEYCVDTPIIIVSTIFFAATLWVCGATFGNGLGLGILFGAAAGVTIASIRLLAETILTQRFGRRTRGAIVAVASAVGGFFMLAGMTASNSQSLVESFGQFAAIVPNWIYWNPFSAGLGVDNNVIGSCYWWAIAPLMATILAVVAIFAATRLTRAGLACSQDTLRGNQVAPRSTSAKQLRLGTSVWKELLQMRRQPEVLGQVLATPLIVFFLLYVGGYQKTLDAALHGANISVTILMGAAYLLLVAATQMIRGELTTLWLLQCQPRPLADIVRDKARVWASLAVGMSLPFVCGAAYLLPNDALSIWAGVPFLIASVWLLAELVFGLTALSASITSEQKIRFQRTAMLIPSLIMCETGLAMYSHNYWKQLCVLATLAILNAAVRQRQLVELPWLSEPVETPPKRLYAMHGLVTFIAFEVLMSAMSVALTQSTELTPLAISSISYSASALIVSLFGCWWLKANGLLELPKLPRGPVLRPVLGGLAASCLAGLVVTFTLRWIELESKLPAQISSDSAHSTAYDKWFLLVLLVVAAPLFEEWIFRGLIYRTLRRTWGVGLSVLVTAVLFATLHPLVGCLAIFTLGVSTALVTEKTGRLWPSILVHAGYNLMIWFLPRV